ncbi:putative phosphotransferase [Actinoplanes missouriensis 431]|uniref:Putative phosphotransferase n=1 Tax=Actinoplanes missouriensis (strain ATCC 14538 / DSM 43046 / CBS 188.64 / JCM 3121 / NBRC 102363 / NCIMB 12654 / NRRL B-3342 / UNCC 431) TaxID=512565 RepID=I0HFN8_ACTM4|nr:aminoglycoside phosphotransferase family protein [Actinoplanes missouriensis]BAL91825.1 putative phosphotransferase [Actinoplanes missouriensis 431]
MRSPTQRSLTLDDIAALVRAGLDTTVIDGAELAGGSFATVWRVTLRDGRQAVVKVGPPPAARLLGYEQGLLPAEAEYFRLVRKHAPTVPVPEVLATSPAGSEPQWVITTLLPGRPLTEGDSPEARRQLGAAVAKVHAITGTRFGYTGDRAAGTDWPTAFDAMVESLRADADLWNVPLPPLDGVVSRHHDVLSAVTRPALLHFDLWDGNVLVAPEAPPTGPADRTPPGSLAGTVPAGTVPVGTVLGGTALEGTVRAGTALGGTALAGIVDGERYLYGDPLLDFVSPALFRRIEDEPDHPFLAGYARTEPWDTSARIRLALYRIHLYVLMITEAPSRGIPPTGERHDFLTTLLTAELKHLATLR